MTFDNQPRKMNYKIPLQPYAPANNSTGPLQWSLKKRDKLTNLIHNTTDIVDRVEFYISVLAPWGENPSANRQNKAIAAIIGVNPETVRLWRSGVIPHPEKAAQLFHYAFNRFDWDVQKMIDAFSDYIGRDIVKEV